MKVRPIRGPDLQYHAMLMVESERIKEQSKCSGSLLSELCY